MRNQLINRYLAAALAALFILLSSVVSFAVAPTEEAIEKWKAEGVLEEKLGQLRAFKEAGGCSPVTYSNDVRQVYRQKMSASADAIDTVHVVVIMAEFSDWPYSSGPVTGTRDKFDSILFSNRDTDPVFNPTGSMVDYYLESSYGKLLIHGEVYGPYMMPNTYAYYVDAPNSGLSGLSSVLANHAVTAADPFVNFAAFNNPGMGVPIIVIHPGVGAETGAYGIWSHKADIFNSPILDGVLLQTYNIVPEEFNGELQAIGVICHEFGHTLGLPDLYDTDGSSEGLGRWSLMASGNYNGDQKLPAHLDPWCKRRIDPIPFIERYDSLLTNRANVAIPAVQFNPVVYQLKDNVAGGGEYWLVENRPALGFDAGLPYGGLCIYHIDQAAGSNNNEARYMVALEQADGLNSLATPSSRGDAGDVWPGSTNNRNFHNLSVPNSKTNVGTAVTQVGVWDISNADSVMYADLDVTYSRPYITLADWDSLLFTESIGDGDGLFEEGETITFRCRLDNLMRPAWDWDISLHSNNPDIEILDSNVQQTRYLSPTIEDDFYSDNPIRFRLKMGAEPRITTFTLTVRADSSVTSGDRLFTEEFVFDKAMGPVSVLIVDDDNGDIAGGTEYEESFYRLQIPYHVWNKQSQGSPTYNDLNKYSHIFWATGSRSLGGGLNASDITALKAFMDDGGNFALGSASAAYRLHLSDSAFMRDYLHTRYTDSVTTTSGLYYWGVTGSPMTDGIKFRVASSAPNEVKRMYRLTPANGGQVALEYTTLFIGNPPRVGNVGILYSGTHKSVLTSVGFEYLSISDTLSGWAHRDSMFARVMSYFEGPTDTLLVPDFHLIFPTESDQNVLNQNPTFVWSALAPSSFVQEALEIAIGTDQEWTYAEAWNPAPVISADTAVIYAGSPLLDGQTYHVRVRLRHSGLWTDWRVASFRMNSVPSAPALRSPTNSAVAGSMPTLWVTNAFDAESDLLTYEFDGYHDTDCVAGPPIDLIGVASGVDSTGGQIAESLAENCRYWWRARAFDGYEYSPWTEYAQFMVNGQPEAPAAPMLDYPPLPDNKPIFVLLPTLSWESSSDPDPGDSVSYRVEISLFPSFTLAFRRDSLAGSSYPLTDSLAFGTHYWWRVTAMDRIGLMTTSTARDFWTWKLGDINHSHGVDLSDLSFLIGYLTQTPRPEVSPKLVADVTGDCKIDLSDLSLMILHLTSSGVPLEVGCE